MRSMVCKGYEQIVANGLVKLFASDRPQYPDGGQQRDFVYVKDAVDMTLWFADKPEINGIFNVGTGQANDWNRLITAIFRALDREPNIRYVPMPEHLKGKYQYTCRIIWPPAGIWNHDPWGEAHLPGGSVPFGDG